ncbi:MAG TPA: MIP/aquaporin family protein [Fimbriimonas sp.]|nr:MIP/aquaporin family protein [Fimbriimonas sp.]
MRGPKVFRRYLAEFLGTLMIVLPPVLLASSGRLQGGDPSLLAAALISGLPVLAMIYTLGSISAAHFNPAVTIAFALAKRFPWKYTPQYIVAQLLGGIAAAAIGYLIFGSGAGAHIPADTTAVVRNISTEVVLTFHLMIVIMGVATDKRVSGTVPGLAIGLTVVVCVLIGGPITGGSMNPARSFGPALFVPGALTSYWIYLVGPCIGAALAAVTFESIRLESAHAKGAPDLAD